MSSENHDARVVAQHRGTYEVNEAGERRTVTLAGALLHTGDVPTVGDRVRLQGDVIVGLEPRSSLVMRAGGQLLAANVDQAWIVVAVGRDINARRVERFLALAAAARVDPIVIVNKSDLGDPPLAELTAVAGGAPVLPVSALNGTGLDALALGPGQSAVLLGSSGAGKSTLINALLGVDKQATGPVREYDERGRHTTTHRELVELPNGSLLIDTPGIKVVGLAATGSEAAFPDIDALARDCRFADCAHDGEPGCAVAGVIEPERLAAYKELRTESALERRRHERSASRAQRRYYGESATR